MNIILAQSPNFSPEAYGFNDKEDYEEHVHLIGNLTILSDKNNKSAQNKTPSSKVSIYQGSGQSIQPFKITRQIASKISSGELFDKDKILSRTDEIVDFCTNRWWC